MHKSNSLTFASIAAFAHRMVERMNQSANDRLSLQMANSPIAVLGAAAR